MTGKTDFVKQWFEGTLPLTEAWARMTGNSGHFIDTYRTFGLVGIDLETGNTIVFNPGQELIAGPVLTTEQAVRAHAWAMERSQIQDYLPDLSDDDREFLLSGIPGEEFDKLFAPETEGEAA